MTSLLLACLLPAATTPIGVVVSDGHLILNNTDTTGNATVLEGSSVQTGSSGASIRLNSGAQVILGADSRGMLSHGRLVLELGSAKTAGYSVNANHLNISVDHSSSASVSLHGKAVEVAAVSGNIHVFGATGVNVANLLAGDALLLQPEDSAPAVSSLTGCIGKKGASYLLTDETSKVTVVLHGNDLKAGKRVQVSGQMVDEPGSSNKGLNVQKLTELSGGCKSQGKAAAAGAGGAAAGAAGGVSVAMIAGVAVAGATAATAIAVTQTSSSSASSTTNSLSNGR